MSEEDWTWDGLNYHRIDGVRLKSNGGLRFWLRTRDGQDVIKLESRRPVLIVGQWEVDDPYPGIFATAERIWPTDHAEALRRAEAAEAQARESAETAPARAAEVINQAARRLAETSAHLTRLRARLGER